MAGMQNGQFRLMHIINNNFLYFTQEPGVQ